MKNYDITAEMVILSTAMQSNDALYKCASMLDISDFYDSKNQAIYKILVEIVNQCREFDGAIFKAVADSLKAEFDYEHFVNILNECMSSSNIDYHIKKIKDCAIVRKINKLAHNINGYCENGKEVEEIIRLSESGIYDAIHTNEKKQFVKVDTLIPQAFDDMEKRAKKITCGVSTGFKKLNESLGGFNNGELIILAGRPGMGKTALATCLTVNARLPVALFELEMSDVQLMHRLFSMYSGVNLMHIRNGSTPKTQYMKIAEVTNTVSGLPVYLDTSFSISISQLRSKAYRIKAQKDIKMIVIDYLQLIQQNRKSESKRHDIEANTRALKGLAKDLDVPVIVLSQLSRACEQRDNKRPLLSDLRESGAIEQDADVVMFVYRDEVYNATPENHGKAEIIVAKNRNGQTGKFDVRFNAETTKFFDHDEGIIA